MSGPAALPTQPFAFVAAPRPQGAAGPGLRMKKELAPPSLSPHSSAVGTRPAGPAAEMDPPARRPHLPTCGARPGRVARRLCCACPPRQRRAAGRLRPGPSAPAARRPGLARRHGNGGRGSGEAPASAPRPERAAGTERAVLRGPSGAARRAPPRARLRGESGAAPRGRSGRC